MTDDAFSEAKIAAMHQMKDMAEGAHRIGDQWHVHLVVDHSDDEAEVWSSIIAKARAEYGDRENWA